MIPHNGVETSVAAARSIEGVASNLRARVLAGIKAAGENGLTCDDVERVTGLRHQTASARVNELARDGAIVDTGIRRATASGRKAIVWRAS